LDRSWFIVHDLLRKEKLCRHSYHSLQWENQFVA
jgi:hypothetical protein